MESEKDTAKSDDKVPINATKITENIQTSALEPNGVKAEKKDVKDSIFITEEDLFDVRVQYYKENKKLFVKNISEDYDYGKKCSEIMVSLKRPSQGDCDIIYNMSTQVGTADYNSLQFLQKMELFRLVILARSWSLPEPLVKDKFFSMDPKIIKAFCIGIMSEIGKDGIV